MPEHIFEYIIDMGETTAHVISVWVTQASDIFVTRAITFANATYRYFFKPKKQNVIPHSSASLETLLLLLHYTSKHKPPLATQ